MILPSLGRRESTSFEIFAVRAVVLQSSVGDLPPNIGSQAALCLTSSQGIGELWSDRWPVGLHRQMSEPFSDALKIGTLLA